MVRLATDGMLLVPIAADGFELVRQLPVFGHERGCGHAELRFHGVRLPAANVDERVAGLNA